MQAWAFDGGSDDKESACNAGYPGSIPGSGRFPGEGMAYHSSIFAWRIPWTEEPSWLLSSRKGLLSLLVHGVAKSWT